MPGLMRALAGWAEEGRERAEAVSLAKQLHAFVDDVARGRCRTCGRRAPDPWWSPTTGRGAADEVAADQLQHVCLSTRPPAVGRSSVGDSRPPAWSTAGRSRTPVDQALRAPQRTTAGTAGPADCAGSAGKRGAEVQPTDAQQFARWLSSTTSPITKWLFCQLNTPMRGGNWCRRPSRAPVRSTPSAKPGRRRGWSPPARVGHHQHVGGRRLGRSRAAPAAAARRSAAWCWRCRRRRATPPPATAAAFVPQTCTPTAGDAGSGV